MFENIELFKDLSETDKKTLEAFCQVKDLNKGEILFNEGEEASSMYILRSGLLEAYNPKPNGTKNILGVITVGCPVGEMALFQGSNKRGASVCALEKSILITILGFSIKQLTQKHPEILEKIKFIINKRNG